MTPNRNRRDQLPLRRTSTLDGWHHHFQGSLLPAATVFESLDLGLPDHVDRGHLALERLQPRGLGRVAVPAVREGPRDAAAGEARLRPPKPPRPSDHVLTELKAREAVFQRIRRAQPLLRTLFGVNTLPEPV